MCNDRHVKLDANTLAERFGFGLKRAHATLRVTAQQGTRSAILPISRRYKVDRMFNTKQLAGKFATDTLWATTKSIKGNVCAQIYSHKCRFFAPYLMTRANGENVGTSLGNFISDSGVPEHLTYDGALVQVGSKTKFMDLIWKKME